MPRSARLVIPNYPHHVIQRGHNRQTVFASDDDYTYYLYRKGDRFILFQILITQDKKSLCLDQPAS